MEWLVRSGRWSKWAIDNITEKGENKFIRIFMKSSKLSAILSVTTNRKDTQSMEIILKTTELTKSFKGKIAVNRISLSIERNSVYGLLGPNGAGKS